MRRIHDLLHNRQGISYVKTAAIVLLFCLLLSLILTYASWMTMIQTTRADTQRVLDSFCIEKAREIYSSIKQGNNQMSRGEYTDAFMAELIDELGLAKSGETVYHKGDSGEIIYRFSNPLISNLRDDTLTLTTDYELVFPVTFAGKRLTDLHVPLRVTSAYVLRD